MTMHIVFLKDYDGYKKEQSCYVERALARRFCRNEIAIPYQKHLDNLYEAELAKKKAEQKKKADKEKAELLKKKKAENQKKADSKKPKKAEKAVKK